MAIPLTRASMQTAIVKTLRSLGGSATPLVASKAFYATNRTRIVGDTRFTWQMDLRWAINALRQEGRVIRTAAGTGRKWTLS